MNASVTTRAPLAAACALALLSACGGGGGDSTPAPPATGGTTTTAGFDASTYATRAEPVAQSVLAAGTTGSLPASLLLGTNVGPASANAHALGGAAWVQPLAGWALHTAGRAQPLAVQDISSPCDGGGSVSGTFDDADNSSELSANDSFSITANACVIDGSTLRGTLKLHVDAYSLSAGLDQGSATLALTFEHLAFDGVDIDGKVTLGLGVATGEDTISLQYQNVVSTSGGQSVTLGITATLVFAAAGDGTLAMAGPVTLGSSAYTLAQTTPFHLSATDGLPDAGTLTVTETLGARVQIVAGPQYFTYQYFSAGNSGATPDASVQGAKIR